MGTAHLRDRARYRRATDMYAVGREHVLKSGDVIYLMAMNIIEKDEAVSDAMAARAHLALALRDPESAEAVKVRAMFEADGPDDAINRLVESIDNRAFEEAVDELEEEEGWAERILMLRRGPDLNMAAGEEEQAFYKRTLMEFTELIGNKMDQIKARERERLEDLPAEDLFTEYLAWWADLRGGEVGIVEYRHTELFYSARACIATPPEEGGTWDHSGCESHQVRLYDDKAALRHEPDEFLQELFEALAESEVTERQAKLRAALASSSDSPAPRNEPVDSTPSSPAATP